MTRAAVALALLLAGGRAWACAECLDHRVAYVGVDDDGQVATVFDESTGESNSTALYNLVMARGHSVACRAVLDVYEGVSIEVTGERACEEVLGLGPKQKVSMPDHTRPGERWYKLASLEREQLLTKVRARYSPLVGPVVSPAGIGVEAMPHADGYDGEIKIQPLTIEGVQVGHVVGGASRWALATYTHPRFDGVIVRMTTLMSFSDQRIGSSSHCTDYSDEYLAVSTRRIASARLIAAARRAPTREESRELAARAVESDPEWSGAQNELERRERRAKHRR